EQVQRAIAAARQMHRCLRQLNQNWQRRGLVEHDGSSPVRFRCGIHQGVAVVGMLGGSKRSDYTAIGPCVNIASRLQEAAEPNSILVSADVANFLYKDAIIKSRALQLKGIEETFLSFAVKPGV
ncbi:MAG: adenylate/guanylate cyclase domain-containing protein, partial [Merismopedia sp. SIO2A8]|nr:adenylate/guanylate cyclase domain-containing protein [Merismopedia sp. SIO2A8]